jgi:all-trans-retinol dehydrogenase (NAD+)
MTEISNRRALVTGAASGIGRLLAIRLADAGARLVLWDIDPAGLGRTQAALAAAGHDADVYCCDLANREEIATAAARTLAESGPVDILINNAGIVSGKYLLDASDPEIERTFQVNTLALFWTVRAFLPSMLERDSGHLVTVASAAGLAGTAKLTDYCSSKFAAVGFDESLRLELKQQNSIAAPGAETAKQQRHHYRDLPLLHEYFDVRRGEDEIFVVVAHTEARHRSAAHC